MGFQEVGNVGEQALPVDKSVPARKLNLVESPVLFGNWTIRSLEELYHS